MIEYTLEVKAMSVVCREGRLKGAHKFVTAPGMIFYVIGRPQHRIDLCVNVAINKALEHGRSAKSVVWPTTRKSAQRKAPKSSIDGLVQKGMFDE